MMMKAKNFVLIFYILRIILSEKLINENNFIEIKYKNNYKLIEPNTAFIKNFNKFIIGHINALGKHFKFIAHKSQPLHVELRSDEHGTEHHYHHHYVGNLLWNRHSKVVGYLHDGKFFGFISTADNVYHIERKLHFNGMSDLIVMYDEQTLHSHQSTRDIFENYHREKRNIQSPILNFIENTHQVDQRQHRPGIRPLKNKRCSLMFFIDKLVNEIYLDNQNMIVGETALLVQRTTQIFEAGDFDFDGHSDKIGIELEHIVIFRDRLIYDPRYQSGGNKEHISNALERCSLLVRRIKTCLNFCDLGFVLHGLPFRLGLTFSVNNESIYSGICAPPYHSVYNISNQLEEKTAYKNTGIIMNHMNGRQFLRYQKAVVLTHEICHTFGCTHDVSSEVNDDDPIHNIMRNNVLYIQSLKKIYFPEKTRLEINETLHRQGGCLIESIKYCGNALVEDGEQCDCGNSTICSFVDPCCERNTCTLRNSVECDPADICCSFFCRKIYNHFEKCNLPCMSDSHCRGTSSECPSSEPLRLGSICDICMDEQCRCDGRGKCISLDDYLDLRYRIRKYL